MVSWCSTKDHKRNRSRGLLLTGTGGSTPHSLTGHTGKSRQGASRERERGRTPGHMHLSGSVDGVLWGSQAKAEMVHSKEQGFHKFHRGLI